MKRRSVFAGLAAACLLLLGGSVPLTADTIPAQETADDPTVYAAASPSMEQICQRGEMTLFASLTTGEFAVKNETTGQLWFSNPQDREDDPYSGSDRVKTFSQLLLHHIDTNTLSDGYTTSYEAEVEESISVAKQADGIVITYKFYDLRIAIPLRITLTEQGVQASVDVTGIHEDADKRLLDISLLPYFGAGGVEDTGYIVVPDGCGALIDFNNGRQNLASYNEPVYGRDVTLIGDGKTKLQENSALPLFGMKNGNQGFAAIITDGDAVASVVAGVSKKGSGYNNAYACFTLRSSGSVELSGKEMRVYEENTSHVRSCAVEYRLLTGDNADYTGIAKAYSDYLLKNGVTPTVKKTTSLLMEVYGAVRIDHSVLGIPAKITKPLTTFEQAGDLAEKFKEEGVHSLTLLYSDYDRNALCGKLTTKMVPESKLGGSGGYDKLRSRLDDMGVTLVSNVDLTTYQHGLLKNWNAAKAFGGLPGVTYFFDLGTNEPDPSVSPFYHLAPGRFLASVSRFVKKYNAERYGAIGLDTLAKNLYSDLAKSNYSGRQQTLNTFAKGAQELSNAADLYVRGGAAWLLAHTDYIYDMPSDTSHTELEERPIPLYQLAVSGIVPYSLEAVNRSSDPQKAVLRCAEYGADIKYDFTYESIGISGEPDLGYLSGVWAEQWQGDAVQAYARLVALDSVLSGKMLRHDKVAEDVFVTTYEGGRVAVNYRDEDIRIGNTTVKAKDFSLLKEGDSYGG